MKCINTTPNLLNYEQFSNLPPTGNLSRNTQTIFIFISFRDGNTSRLKSVPLSEQSSVQDSFPTSYETPGFTSLSEVASSSSFLISLVPSPSPFLTRSVSPGTFPCIRPFLSYTGPDSSLNLNSDFWSLNLELFGTVPATFS